MYTVAICSQTGGVGKTTLTNHLTLLAHREGLTVATLDSDPVGEGAFGWYMDRRKKVARELVAEGKFATVKEAMQHLAEVGEPRPLFLKVATVETLKSAFDVAKEESYDWLFIDTAAGINELTPDAVALADLVLIPCIGSRRKMLSAKPTVDLVKRLAKPAFFVVNLGSASKSINDDCALSLASRYGLPATATHITDRKPIRYLEDRAETLNEVERPNATSRNGAAEFVALWEWLKTQVGANDEGETEHEQAQRVAIR